MVINNCISLLVLVLQSLRACISYYSIQNKQKNADRCRYVFPFQSRSRILMLRFRNTYIGHYAFVQIQSIRDPGPLTISTIYQSYHLPM
jgi:hypothetical protein